jgi:hypothetical protein
MAPPKGHPLDNVSHHTKSNSSGSKSKTKLDRSKGKRKTSSFDGQHGSRKSSKKNDISEAQSQTTIPTHATSNSNLQSPPVPVPNVWVTGGISSVADSDREKVKIVVSKHLWHDVKFITDKEHELTYNDTDPTTICYNVLAGLKLSENIEKSIWWNTKGKFWVYEFIGNLRNSKMTALKKAFFGK